MPLRGTVVDVKDGDTVTLELGGGIEEAVRVWGIDAPESDQPHGPTARARARSVLKGETVYLNVKKRGPYDRIIGELWTQDAHLGRYMVAEGHAWADRKHGHSGRLSALEQQARQEGAGLWAQDNPVPPWQHRDTTGPTHGAGQNVGWGTALFVVIVVGLLSLLSLAAG